MAGGTGAGDDDDDHDDDTGGGLGLGEGGANAGDARLAAALDGSDGDASHGALMRKIQEKKGGVQLDAQQQQLQQQRAEDAAARQRRGQCLCALLFFPGRNLTRFMACCRARTDGKGA
jgi:hypothetical protein